MIRKVCNTLLESSLNHNLTIKHLRITVDREYTYGLPRFHLGILGHGIQPIRYRRMLKSMDSFNLSRVNLWDSVCQNHISRVSFKLLYRVSRDNWNYDQASNIFKASLDNSFIKHIHKFSFYYLMYSLACIFVSCFK